VGFTFWYGKGYHLCPLNSYYLEFKMGPRIRNESGESKKNVTCGICFQSGRRDNMKRTHFPKKHPGKRYFEKGEQLAKTVNDFFSIEPETEQNEEVNAIEEGSDSENENSINGDEDDVDMVSEVLEPTDQSVVVERCLEPDNSDGALNVQKDVINNIIEPCINKVEKLLCDQMDKIKLLVDNRDGTSHKKEVVDNDIDDDILRLKACRSIEDLCIIGGFSMYKAQKKIVCDLCDENGINSGKKAAEFSYDFDTVGIDFRDSNMPRKFRSLKESLVDHIYSKGHKDALDCQEKRDKKDTADELYNYKVGMKLGSMVYQNIKERCSYAKYSRDVAAAALNGEEVGNRNHGEDFAKNLADDMGTEAKIELTKYFHKVLPCNGELPPVMFASDKMTMKKKTGHISGGITPDVNAPLSEPLLKPVFFAMPIARYHSGEGLAKQMLEIMQLFISDVTKQVQGICNDGQYVHLDIKKHLENLVIEFQDQENWLMFSWDPSHRIALASNDASKDNTDGSKKEGSLKDVFDLVQTINKHVGYGKHNLELETILKSLGINDKNKPLTFSDTRFPQYAYFVLRNFINSYPALIQQMEYEISYTKATKSGDLKETLKNATSVEFVVKVVGATDVFRRQQKVDQLISDVYDNIKLQKDKLERMDKDLESPKHPDNWNLDDLESLDDHLWCETKKALAEIITSKTFKTVKLRKEDKQDIGIAVVELRNHIKRNVFALQKRFEHDFDSKFVREVKDAFDFNFMIGLVDDFDEEKISQQEVIDVIDEHGNDAIRALIRRKSKANPASSEQIIQVISQYKKVKSFALEILMDQNMNKIKRQIREYGLERRVVCFLCHRRILSSKMMKHNKDIHKGARNQFGDEITTFSSIKIIHGICKSDKLYQDKQNILSLALEIFCKTPNESVIECIGSVAELHTKPQRNSAFHRFENELMVDWNGPVLSKAKNFIEKSLDRHFGSRKNWNFKTGSSKFFVSQVVDRINSQPSRLTFME
jgi:hypothetical protein